MSKAKKLSKPIIALITVGCIIAALGLTVLGFFIGFWVSDATVYCWNPDYDPMPEAQLKALFESAETDEEYELLFEQTGLTKIGIERARARSNGWQRVREIHDSYFRPRKVRNAYYAPLICTDHIDDFSREIFLEKGDILITSSTHFSGFRIGHSGIVANPGSDYPIWQATQIGDENGYASVIAGFTNRNNFMVIRIKPQAFGAESATDEKYLNALNDVVNYITTELKDAKYSPLTGIFTPKDKCEYTSCSHLLWYGFKHFDDKNGGARNIDLDSNGRLLAMPKNIAESEYVELVQTFGFNPDKMYE